MSEPTGPGRPRACVEELPAYRPGKDAKQAEAEHGIVEAIKLASNENPLPPLPAVVEAVATAAEGLNRYADHRASALRARLTEVLGLEPDRVTVGCGSVGLLQQIVLTYVDAGDDVVFPWRSFEVYPIYTQLAGGRALKVPLDESFAVDIDAVIHAVTPRTKVVLLATPNNPTGTAVATAELDRLLRRVPRSVVVVADEAYREFVDPRLGDPVTELVPEHPHLLVTRTLSKAQGLAGLRLGYAVGHPEVISSIDKTLVPFAVNALAQAAAVTVLRPDVAAQINDRVAGILVERDRVVAALIEAGWVLPDAQANFVYLPLGARTDEVNAGLERRGVVARPFSGEGIRVTIGTASENDRFLAALGEVVSLPT